MASVLRAIGDVRGMKSSLALRALVAAAAVEAAVGRDAGETQVQRKTETMAAADDLLFGECTEWSDDSDEEIQRGAGYFGKVAEESRRRVGKRIVAE